MKRNPGMDVAATSEAPTMDGEALLSCRWQLSDDVVIETNDADRVTLFHRVTAARLMVTSTVHRFLRALERPRRLDELFPEGVPPQLQRSLRTLIEKGILYDPDAPPVLSRPRVRAPVAYRFCNAPALASGVAVDAAILGVPYDLASDIDCREAPARIRRRSLDHAYEVSMSTGLPQGWFDVNRAVRILKGVRIADGGDVPVRYGESQSALFARIGDALDEILAHDAVPLVLGGDRSITFAVVERLSRRERLVVVQCAPSLACHDPDADDAVAATAVGLRLARHPRVDAVIAVGDIESQANAAPSLPELHRVSAAALRADPAHDWIERIGRDRAVHLSIDLGLATLEYMRPNSDGLAPGLTLDALRRSILAIGATQRIVSIDLVGLDTRSEEADVASAIACHFALTAMSATLDRPGTAP